MNFLTAKVHLCSFWYICIMDKKRILFVCLGNICRSPAAEGIFAKKAAEKGLKLKIDSAGTSAWHQGEKADARMRKHARERGYDLSSISRRFDARSDFDAFDLIIAMDDQNYYDLMEQARTPEEEEKIHRMRDFLKNQAYDHIPDPYYGGASGFDLVIDLLEEGAESLLDYIKE